MRADVNDPKPDLLVDWDMYLDYLWGRAYRASGDSDGVRAITCALFVS